MKVFLDTNVLIDFLDDTRPRHQSVLALIANLSKNNRQVLISENILSTTYYILHNKKRTLYQFDGLLKKWKIVPFGKKVIKNAIDLSLEEDLDLEDALQCLCAKHNQCDVFLTNDKYFSDCGVNIQTPQQFLAS